MDYDNEEKIQSFLLFILFFFLIVIKYNFILLFTKLRFLNFTSTLKVFLISDSCKPYLFNKKLCILKKIYIFFVY